MEPHENTYCPTCGSVKWKCPSCGGIRLYEKFEGQGFLDCLDCGAAVGLPDRHSWRMPKEEHPFRKKMTSCEKP